MVHRAPFKTAFLIVVWAGAVWPGYAGEADALAISSNIQTRHLPFGTILDPIFASSASNQLVGYTRCGDSAIWTGHYLAAEAFRYQVTAAPDALTNVRNAIAGIESLVDVTGTGLLARCRVPSNSPFAAGIQSEEAHNGIYTNGPAGYIWVGNTSRDEYAGVMFGLGVAFDMVNDPGVQDSISKLVTRVVDFLTSNAWLVVMPDGSISTTFLGRPDQILSFLQVARHVNPGHFSALFDEQSLLLSAALLIPVGLDVASDDSYFKFNLDYICFYNLIRLDTTAGKAFRPAYDLLRLHTAPHQNAFFNLIDRALNGPDAQRDGETSALLTAWLGRPRRDIPVDLHGVVPVCGDQACQPVPVPLRPPSDFLWQRNPFQLVGLGKGVIESAGIDYILPYWMARYYAVTAAFTVQSAASAIVAVAPGSIASIYGSSLAAAAVGAGAPPLPKSLGGISLMVGDAAGTANSASILYVSSGQINFVVPAGTQPGLAKFTITSRAGSVNAFGTVLPVAPSLFTANQSGAGVAAATAIRTQAAAPGSQTSVPVFTCNASGCVATPIDLGTDTPVYLTLYGTGIRNLSELSKVTVTINGLSAPVLSAGPQGGVDGVDQVTVTLPLGLRGSGETNIVLVVDGQTANTVTVRVR